MSQTTTAIFLFIGFDAERRHTKKDWPETPGGFLDIPDTIDEMATALEKWYEANAEIESPNWPGCFDYEVTEQMGAWLFLNFECTADEFTAELDRYVKAWSQTAVCGGS